MRPIGGAPLFLRRDLLAAVLPLAADCAQARGHDAGGAHHSGLHENDCRGAQGGLATHRLLASSRHCACPLHATAMMARSVSTARHGDLPIQAVPFPDVPGGNSSGGPPNPGYGGGGGGSGGIVLLHPEPVRAASPGASRPSARVRFGELTGHAAALRWSPPSRTTWPSRQPPCRCPLPSTRLQLPSPRSPTQTCMPGVARFPPPLSGFSHNGDWPIACRALVLRAYPPPFSSGNLPPYSGGRVYPPANPAAAFASAPPAAAQAEANFNPFPDVPHLPSASEPSLTTIPDLPSVPSGA